MSSLRQLLFLTVTALGISAGATWAQGGSGTVFSSANEAVERFVTAGRRNDVATLEQILGKDGHDVLHSGDAQSDSNARKRFVAAYDARHKLVDVGGGRMALLVGTDDWPLPIPVVKTAEGWQFDAASGRAELLARRIGRNELVTIEACKAFVDAQREYAAADRGDGVLTYARRFVSTPGKKDGLYWLAKKGEAPSPLGPIYARAQAAGYEPGKNAPQAYNGYYFRILLAQGPAAKGGAYSYLAHGKMMGGFALIAYPASYGVSGVMTFIVNHDGDVFQKDLGPKTGAAAAQIKTFNPDAGWKKA
jgi:hypothetical protein